MFLADTYKTPVNIHKCWDSSKANKKQSSTHVCNIILTWPCFCFFVFSPRLYWRRKSPTNQPWSCTRTWVLSETSGCSDTTWTEWTRCGSNCGSARGKKRGDGGGRDSGCCSPRTLSAWRPQLCPGHFTLIHTHTHTLTHTGVCT